MRRFLCGRLIKTFTVGERCSAAQVMGHVPRRRQGAWSFHRSAILGFVVIALAVALSANALEIKPTRKEMQTERSWFKEHSPEGKIHFTEVWADARVILANGQELWLGDMPLRDHRNEAGFPPIARKTELPFSFVYGGRSSDDLLAGWPKETFSRTLDAFRTEHTVRWIEAKSGLEVRFVAVEYNDFPAVEWTVYFKNTSQANTPILENIQALDTRFERRAEGEFVLHGN